MRQIFQGQVQDRIPWNPIRFPIKADRVGRGRKEFECIGGKPNTQRASFDATIFSQNTDNREIGVGVLCVEQYSEISVQRVS